MPEEPQVIILADGSTVVLTDSDAMGPTGPSGPHGLAGPRGLQGSTGPKGDRGLVGPSGPMGPSGPLGATGPRGFTGATGVPGATGAQGLQGNTGAKGDRGFTGPIGPTGPKGPTGPQGATGPAGRDGAPGSQGPTGARGEVGQVGYTGPTGPRGHAGATGATGPKGNPGTDGIDGQDGERGATGAMGMTGPTGPRGATGPTGETGPAGDLGMTGATGPAGVDGRDGIDGEAGPTGATGPEGIQGERGFTGASGAQGIPGIAGPTGPKGDLGSTGPTGPIGDTGWTGPKGETGAIGATGPQGIPGIDGTVGATGATGPAGADGTDGVDGNPGPAGPTGATGPQGLPGNDGIDGTQGATGATGPQGIPGNDGAQGIPGAAGATGATGPKGNTGNQGATGPAGLNGATGATGPQGIQGPAGATGPQGTLGWTGPAGASGTPGTPGAIGATGPRGFTGPAGPAGATGPQGLSGSPGSAGATGATGPAGATGATNPNAVVGPATSIDDYFAGFSGSGGKTLKQMPVQYIRDDLNEVHGLYLREPNTWTGAGVPYTKLSNKDLVFNGVPSATILANDLWLDGDDMIFMMSPEIQILSGENINLQAGTSMDLTAPQGINAYDRIRYSSPGRTDFDNSTDPNDLTPRSYVDSSIPDVAQVPIGGYMPYAAMRLPAGEDRWAFPVGQILLRSAYPVLAALLEEEYVVDGIYGGGSAGPWFFVPPEQMVGEVGQLVEFDWTGTAPTATNQSGDAAHIMKKHKAYYVRTKNRVGPSGDQTTILLSHLETAGLRTPINLNTKGSGVLTMKVMPHRRVPFLGDYDSTLYFAIPDLKGKTVAGPNTMRYTADGWDGTGTTYAGVLPMFDRITNEPLGHQGQSGGDWRSWINIAQMPSHTHTSPNGSPFLTDLGTGTAVNSAAGSSYGFRATSSATQAAGGGQAHSNMQPTLVDNWIIRLK